MIGRIPIRQEPVGDDRKGAVAGKQQRAPEINPRPELEDDFAVRIDAFCGEKIQIGLADLKRVTDVCIDCRSRRIAQPKIYRRSWQVPPHITAQRAR
jgi:hypothetical protein